MAYFLQRILCRFFHNIIVFDFLLLNILHKMIVKSILIEIKAISISVHNWGPPLYLQYNATRVAPISIQLTKVVTASEMSMLIIAPGQGD